MIKKIIWFNPELIQSGGGERVILEGLKCFKKMGIDPHLVVYEFNEKATFGGAYNPNVHILGRSNSTLKRLLILRREIKRIAPDLIITQAQWGCVDLYLATLFTPFLYVAHIFGTLFAFSGDLGKYALIFRRHFNEIRSSVKEYSEVIPKKLPGLGMAKRLVLEFKAFFRYLSVRKAKKIFTFANQTKWEIYKLYNRNAVVLRGAFPLEIFDYKIKKDIKKELGLGNKKVVLSVSRLFSKKRIDLCIAAFNEAFKHDESVALVIGGTGPDRDRLEAIVGSLGLKSRVLFVGYIAEKELWDYFACCDLFVYLDIEVSFSITPYEALALGSKVSWSNEMETDEVLKQNRFIFAANPEIKDLATAMKNAIAVDLDDMNQKEIELLSTYAWENYFSSFIKEAEEVLKN